MTNKELQEKLKAYHDDARIMVFDGREWRDLDNFHALDWNDRRGEFVPVWQKTPPTVLGLSD